MKLSKRSIRSLLLAVVVTGLLALFVWVVVRAGPMAPVSVTVTRVENTAIEPTVFGIGAVEARHIYRIGATAPGRLQSLDVDVGDTVKAGQVLGRMAPVDLDDRSRAAAAAQQQAQAMLIEAQARHSYAGSQFRRYEKLARDKYVSAESVSARRQEAEVASAGVRAAREALNRARAEEAAIYSQRANLDLISPVDGVVALRSIDPGTTVVAGQTVVEVINPSELWVHTRLDQGDASGLVSGLTARIVLRSRSGASMKGQVLRVEPKADVITEETLAKVVFAIPPQPLPPLGELAEVTVTLPKLAATPSLPNAALHRVDGKLGVWKHNNGEIAFVRVEVGASDLEGRVQVLRGISVGDEVVLYSEKPLSERSRIKIVEAVPGAH